VNLLNRKSHIDPGVVLKTLPRLILHPEICTKLVQIQARGLLYTLDQKRKADGKAGNILQLGIRITDRCNLRCRTCGQWGAQGFLRGVELAGLQKKEVPVSRYAELFQDLVAHGHFPIVYFWGGEPLLYPGIEAVFTSAVEAGLPVSIATNGTLLDKYARSIACLPLFLVQVSIDGHTAELHNRLRPFVGGRDGFGRIRRGLAVLRRERSRAGGSLPVTAALTVISKENANHLVDIYEAFADRVDLFVFYLSWWIDPKNALRHEEDFQRRFGFVPHIHNGWIGDWRPVDFGRLNHELTALRRKARPPGAPPVTLIPPLTGEKTLRTYYTDHHQRFGFDRCLSIYQAAELNSNGDLSPCRDYHDYVVGNVKDDTITQLWNSKAYRQFRRSLATEGLMPVCSRCCGLMGY
jgi:radical SAM protein with 4Fe4S-binding SPASM domain